MTSIASSLASRRRATRPAHSLSVISVDHGAARLDLRAPFGGMKQSGMGREQGIEGVRALQDTRSIAQPADSTEQA
jgi:acyl-CoA reductase-like NAD-dependent aldehyde dehydrogenase